MLKTLIVPGFRGSGEGHWQHHWLADHDDSELVAQSDWERPDQARWLAGLEAALSPLDDVLLVAHSLGCVLTALLADHPLSARVRGALLVAPCKVATAKRLHPGQISFDSVMPDKALPFPSILVASHTDPYMTFETARSTAALWGSRLVDMGAAGHINPQAGFGRWPDAYALAARLPGFARRAPVTPVPQPSAGRAVAVREDR